ncbi:hypothetical protein [Candidatus Brachybacter algidus]|nr:hypothetical protein [Candidatus Brachybacter algidus]
MPELEQGKRSRMKIFRVDPEKDLPLEMIRMILNKALENLSKEQKNE